MRSVESPTISTTLKVGLREVRLPSGATHRSAPTTTKEISTALSHRRCEARRSISKYFGLGLLRSGGGEADGQRRRVWLQLVRNGSSALTEPAAAMTYRLGRDARRSCKSRKSTTGDRATTLSFGARWPQAERDPFGPRR